jgi:amidase
MSRSLEMLKVYSAAVLSETASPWHLDPKCYHVPWRGETIQPRGRKLRFGIISDNDGEISVHPPIVRGLAMTKAALEAAGHEVFEWTPLNHPAMVEEMNQSFHTLGAAAILDLTLQNEEPVYGSMKKYEDTYKKGEHGVLGPTKLRDMITKRNAFQKAYMDAWNATAADGKNAMDGIILPASCWTAPRLGITQKLFSVNYTGVFNVLGKYLLQFPERAHTYYPRLSCLHVPSHIRRQKSRSGENGVDAIE